MKKILSQLRVKKHKETKIQNKHELEEQIAPKEVVDTINSITDDSQFMQAVFFQNIWDSFLGVRKSF